MRRIIVLIYIPLYLLFSIPYLLLTYCVSLFNRSLTRRMAYLFSRVYALSLLKIMGANLIYTGLENLDEEKNYLFVSNHRSLLDSPVLMTFVKKPLSFISKKEMKKAPILSNWMTLLHCLFLDRDNNRKGLQTILQGIEQMKLGDHLAIFPQGTRSVGQTFLPFKAGSFKLATKSNKPILPVAISGTERIFENNGLNCKPGDVYIHIFPPIATEGLTLESQKLLTAEIQHLIQHKFDEFESHHH